MPIKWVWLAVGAFIGASLLLLGAGLLAQPYAFHGSLIEPAPRAPDIVLNDQNGETFRLDEHQGQVVLVFFGYTSCPDVCPTTLADFKQIREKLGEDADRVRFVFVTVDPQRDTPEKIKAYLQVFDSSITGLSGSPTELEPVWKSYGVYVQKQDGATAAGYLVDHSSRVYAIDTQGNLRLTYMFGTPVNDLVSDVKHLLKEG